jgi:hypothetical protein
MAPGTIQKDGWFCPRQKRRQSRPRAGGRALASRPIPSSIASPPPSVSSPFFLPRVAARSALAAFRPFYRAAHISQNPKDDARQPAVAAPASCCMPRARLFRDPSPLTCGHIARNRKMMGAVTKV